MKIELTTFLNKANGLSLYLVPESSIEHELLDGFWRHGTLATTGQGYAIEWQVKEVDQP